MNCRYVNCVPNIETVQHWRKRLKKMSYRNNIDYTIYFVPVNQPKPIPS